MGCLPGHTPAPWHGPLHNTSWHGNTHTQDQPSSNKVVCCWHPSTLKLALPAPGIRGARDRRAAACRQARGARLRIHTVPYGKRQLDAASAAAHNQDLLPQRI